MNQKEKRQGIDVGPGMFQVSTAAYWYRNGHFKNEDEARGAFFLAYQQGMDGMGKSVAKWMGFNEKEFAFWMKDDSIPQNRKGGRKSK
jgi:hypothetical protein